MKIILNSRFEIDQDEYNFTLLENKIVGDKKSDGTPAKNSGKKRQQIVGYFSSIVPAIERAAELEMSNKNDVIDMRNYIDEYKKILSKFAKILSL